MSGSGTAAFGARSHVGSLLAICVMLALALVAVASLNVANATAGHWWAPFPMWMLPLMFAVPDFVIPVVPAILFAVTVALLVSRSRRTAQWILVATIGIAVAIHLGWAIAFSAEGVMRFGAPFTFGVQAIGALLLAGSGVLAKTAPRHESRIPLVVAAWLVFLWLSWVSMPWFSEGI